MEAIRAVERDIASVLEAAQTGTLSHRVELSRHRGTYATIIGSLNGILDAISRPIADTIQTLNELGSRNLCACVNMSYRGDYARLTNTVNTTSEQLCVALTQLAESVAQISGSMVGRLAAIVDEIAVACKNQASAEGRVNKMFASI